MNPAQDLNQIQLIEKIVLEPEDELIVAVMFLDDPSPQSQIVYRVVTPTAWRASKEAPADVEQCLVGQTGRDGSVVKRVGPDRAESRNARRAERVCEAAAISDMEEARHDRSG